MSEKYSLIGKRLSGLDERDKVLGKVIFADDYTMPGMLYG